MIKRISLLAAVMICALFSAAAVDPAQTGYSYTECEGSMMPYPAPEAATETPDSLTPVFINHVGRHGARFPSSSKNVEAVMSRLREADSRKALTPLGREALQLVEFVAENAHGRWGALDSLGMAEQRGIASRMFRNHGTLLTSGKIHAISSYSPRCVMSMYEFTHQLDRLDNHVEIHTSSGRQNSPLMRFFDLSESFTEYLKQGDWKAAYDMQFATMMPSAPARRLVKESETLSNEEAQKLTSELFSILQGLPAMCQPPQLEKYFTLEEANAAWSCTNLRHYLQRTATTISAMPAEIAADLLLDLITTTEEAVAGKCEYRAMLRFGHAETLMPLLSLMRLRGCYYLTNYFDTVALHWKDFHVVPMAANLQISLFKSKSGKMYVRFDLNERPVPLFPDSDDIYIAWDDAREYLSRCLPLHLRP